MVNETYVLHVTKLCNCDCAYCYEKDKTSTYTWEEVKDTLNNIIEYRTSDTFGIEFLGGEPMLAWDYIKNTIHYIKDNFPNLNVRFTITTNGTIVNDELIDYLNNYPLQFAISLDGHEFANMLRMFKSNYYNTYKTVMENIKFLQDKGYNPDIHITSHPYNIAYLKDSIVHLYEKGLRNIDVGTVEGVMKIDNLYCDRFIKELDEVSELICNGTLKDLEIGIFNWVKPKEDVRTYVKDREGKVIAESYGRSGEDFTYKYPESEGYTVIRCDNTTEIAKMIYFIRSTVYKNHHKRLGDLDTCEFGYLFK